MLSVRKNFASGPQVGGVPPQWVIQPYIQLNIIYIMRIYEDQGESGVSADERLQRDIELFV